MLHCSCTTDVCIFMENVSSFDTFSESHKLNYPGVECTALWISLIVSHSKFSSKLLESPFCSIYVNLGPFSAFCWPRLVRLLTGGIIWVRTFLEVSFLAHLQPWLPRCPSGGAVQFGLPQQGELCWVHTHRPGCPDLRGVAQPAFRKEWPTLLAELNNSPSQKDQVWV